MTYDDTDDINDNEQLDNDSDNDLSLQSKPSDKKDAEVRKRIDDLLEKKRLKELLDDTDDW